MTAVVYFIQGVDDGPIKIGHTIHIERRLKALQNCSPVRLRVVDTHPGDQWVESRLHDALRDYRLWGEWFDDCIEVLVVMRAFCLGKLDDALADVGGALRSSLGREMFLDVRLQIATAEIDALVLS